MENWDKFKEEMKQLRALLKSKPGDKKVRCMVKGLFNSSVAYYESPERYTSNETVLRIVSGRSLSPLEAAFMWLGAWRPSAAVSLVFSVMGVSKEGIPLEIPLELSENVPALSNEQISQLASFREHTNQAEKEVSEELASVQMMLGDQEVVTQLVTGEEVSGGGESSGKLKEMIRAKVGGLREMLKRADQLRIQTLAELHSVLLPMQAAHCGIAAFEVGYVLRSLDSGTAASS